MKKQLIALLAAITILGFGANANAAVLHFDDITETDWIANVPLGYGGFDWNNKAVPNNMIVMNKTYNYWPSLYSAAVSGNYAAINNDGSPMGIARVNSDETFTFNGAYLTVIDGVNYSTNPDAVNSEVVTINGFDRNNVRIAQDFVTIFSNKATFFDAKANFQNIYRLELIGTNPGNNSNIWMDNFAYNGPVAPAPEPSSIVLGLMSIGSLLGFKRKKSV